jgi:hypothetical protein
MQDDLEYSDEQVKTAKDTYVYLGTVSTPLASFLRVDEFRKFLEKHPCLSCVSRFSNSFNTSMLHFAIMNFASKSVITHIIEQSGGIGPHLYLGVFVPGILQAFYYAFYSGSKYLGITVVQEIRWMRWIVPYLFGLGAWREMGTFFVAYDGRKSSWATLLWAGGCTHYPKAQLTFEYAALLWNKEGYPYYRFQGGIMEIGGGYPFHMHNQMRPYIDCAKNNKTSVVLRAIFQASRSLMPLHHHAPQVFTHSVAQKIAFYLYRMETFTTCYQFLVPKALDRTRLSDPRAKMPRGVRLKEHKMFLFAMMLHRTAEKPQIPCEVGDFLV